MANCFNFVVSLDQKRIEDVVILSASEIADVARRAGFSPVLVPTLVGIALAESSGDTNAHDAKPPDDSYGLWQINMIGLLGPQRLKQFGIPTYAALFDPSINARAAYVLSGGGQNLTPWTTYTSGAYKKYVPSSSPFLAPFQGIPFLSGVPYSDYIIPALALFLLLLFIMGGSSKESQAVTA